MKTSTHPIPCLISSLLLSAGFSRVAELFDPLARSLSIHPEVAGHADRCALPCVLPSSYYSPAELAG